MGPDSGAAELAATLDGMALSRHGVERQGQLVVRARSGIENGFAADHKDSTNPGGAGNRRCRGTAQTQQAFPLQSRDGGMLVRGRGEGQLREGEITLEERIGPAVIFPPVVTLVQLLVVGVLVLVQVYVPSTL